MSQGHSAFTASDLYLLLLCLGLFCVLSEQFLMIVAGQLVLIIGRPQNGLLKVIAPLASNNFTMLAEQTGFIVLIIIRTFVSYKRP